MIALWTGLAIGLVVGVLGTVLVLVYALDRREP